MAYSTARDGFALAVSCVVLASATRLAAFAGEGCPVLVSGQASLAFERRGGKYAPVAQVGAKKFGGEAFSDGWVTVEFGERRLKGDYTTIAEKDGKVALRATVKASDDVSIEVTDVFSSEGAGEFRARRRVKVLRSDAGCEPGYFTSFGFGTGDRFGDVDLFIPSVMYKNMFDERANPKRMGLKREHRNFFFREDRLPLPVAMFRRPDGLSASLTLEDTGNRTVLADCRGVKSDPGYLFGGVGFGRNDDDTFSCCVTYPGLDRRAWGLGSRRHPSKDGQTDEYSFRLRFAQSASYGDAVESAWNRALAIYDPPVFQTDVRSAWHGLLATLYSYRQSPDGDQDLVKSKSDKPGFPWSVYLEGEFGVCDTTYELGFVGAQPVAGYCLLQAGVLEGNAGWRKHGEAVVGFWARESLSELGFPNSRYYPLERRWDEAGSTLRQACTGMGGVLDAWSFMKRRGEDRPEWIASCRRFGDWLADNQAADGSWAAEYNPRKVEDGKHPVLRPNKALTVCGVTYLLRLFAATKDARYRTAALKAAEFSYAMQHRDYLYVACVIDNPEVFDSESGYEAMKAFLSAYEADGRRKWLDAARQAAVYTETWVYMHDIPPETDAVSRDTPWPFDRSVVGQHILTIDQPGADLGFAWTAYWYYRLWRHTNDANFLKMARISMHDTKQSMNLGGRLYPGRGEGLQCEVCTLRTTKDRRRGWAMMQALTWNFAAHLQQYASFIDAAGIPVPQELLEAPASP